MNSMARKIRVDQALVFCGLADSLEEARTMVMAGQIWLGEQRVINPSRQVERDAEMTVEASDPYVSRGGVKLAAALDVFQIPTAGLICADVGASTGGFTDCLLQHGAARVYAVDVGYGQLDWRLRQDPRVELLERTNVRYLRELPEPVDLAAVDVSFISLRRVIPVIRGWFPARGGTALMLIKPQFEATRQEAARGAGVIRDPQIHRRVVEEVLHEAQREEFQIRGVMRSPIRGAEGNMEFLAWLDVDPQAEGAAAQETWIEGLF